MKKFLLLAIAFFTFIFVNAQISIGVTPYATLQAAFAAINAGTHTGAITMKVSGTTTETGTAILNASGTGAANYTSITIYPAVSGCQITGNLNAPLIDLNGADNVTLDGRVSASGSAKDLVITNSNTGVLASTIRFIESAQSNTVKYCKLKGASQNASGGVLFFSTSTTGTGNSNNSINNNDISGTTIADANRPINCIFSAGTATRDNTGEIIDSNNFFDFDKKTVPCSALKIFANNSTWTISSNNFYQTLGVTKTANGANLTVINISNLGTNFTVSDNFIGGSAVNCGGSPFTTTGAFNQAFTSIFIDATSSSIQGNTIKNLSWASTNASPFAAIQISTGDFDIGSVSPNIIGSNSGTGSIVVTNTTVNATTRGIYILTTGRGFVSNNNIGSITVVGSATISHSFRAIVITNSTLINISGNFIGSSSTLNSISASSFSTNATGQSVIGIINNSGGSINITGNTINHLSNNYSGTGSAGQVCGIKTLNGTNFINANSINNLETNNGNTGTDLSASVIGLVCSSTLSGQTISRNTIQNLNNTVASAAVHEYGIFYSGGTVGTNSITSNFIQQLSLATTNTNSNITGIRINGGASNYSDNLISLGTGVTAGFVIHGIFENGLAGNNNNIYFNTVYIGGTGLAGSNTAAFFGNANTNTRDIRDNIFDNSRSGGATHYAAYFNYTSAGTLTLNYNDYFAPGSGGVLGFYNGSNAAVLPIIAGNDANSLSVNPAFANAGGTNASDYMPGSLAGTTIAGFSTDYFFTTRPATPTIGALETSCTPPAAPTDITPVANLSICNGTSTTLLASGIGTLGWYDSPAGGTFLGAGANFPTPVLTATTTYYVQDSTCAASVSRTAVIVNVSSLITSTLSQTDVTCNGSSNGIASVSVSGGTPGYSYLWTPIGGTSATASSLIAGTYSCTITDANSCSLNETFTITEPSALSSVNSQTNLNCNGAGNGSATVSVSGGTSPYSYSWAPSGGTSTTAPSLSGGTYTCTITDANSCTLNETFTILEPAPLSSSDTQTNLTCNGSGNGSATVSVSGGSAPYSYSWSPAGGTSATASSLTAGTYTCTITDANSCSLNETFTITEPATLSSSDTQTDLTCNGAGNGSATVSISGGTSLYSYSWAPVGGTSATASSLSAGNYTCTITDANSCLLNETFTITEPAVISSSDTQSDLACNGSGNGSASVSVSGGNLPYVYSWSPSGGSAATASSLAAGTYTCTITDAGSCSLNETFTITEPAAISSVDSQTNLTCNAAGNGSATVSVSGGNLPYTYSWSPSGGTAATASSLSAGNYTCTITDANSCSLNETFTITAPAVLAAVKTKTDVTCFGGSNGSATVTPSGGTSPYTYLWFPSGGTAATENGLAAGAYNCTITDANGCTLVKNFIINSPPPITSTPFSQTDLTCNGANNGSATVNAGGGIAPYTYSWLPSGGTAATASSLAAGNYTCTITDANSCSFNQTFTITAPLLMTDVPSQTNISCNGGSNGSATVTISGGSAPYTYAWLPSGGIASTASSLTAGNYTCTVTDANSCTFSETFSITEPSVLTATTSQVDNTCGGGANGSATVVVSGGTAVYSYLWIPSGGNSATASSLAAGSYTCTITDANSCTLQKTFSITEPPLLSSTTAQTNISCSGGSNGSASVNASGGTPTYTYSWSPSGGNAATANSLSAGNYTCTITDANACSLIAIFNITAPSALSSSSSQIDNTCNGGSSGSATVAVSGGTPSYSYSWLPSGGSGATASSLTAGTYTCTITDGNACTLAVTFTITEPAAITSANSQTNNSCFSSANGSATVNVSGGNPGYTYSWAPSGGTAATASSLSAGNYTCTITDASACSHNETFTITAPPALSVAPSQTNVSCNGGSNGSASVVISGGTPGYSYSWSPVGGTAATASFLASGNYTCTITDANSCVITQTFSITQPSPLSVSASQTNVSCNGGSTGSATVLVSGGIPAYSYNWTPTGGTSATSTSLAAGNYTCTVTDGGGCIITQGFSITEPSPLVVIPVTQTNVSCNGGSNGSATVLAFGGTLAYSYNWIPSGGNAATASGLTAGNYTCTVTDANLCTSTQTFNITQTPAITATSSQTNISCNGGINGSATVSVSGGNPGYTYTWSPTGGTAATASSLAAGNYTCTITDANTCSITVTFVLTQAPAIVVTPSQTNITCNSGTNGSATVAVTGGTPGYIYSWLPSGGNAAIASSLTAGSYTCSITDVNSCIITQTFNITQPAAFTITPAQTNVSCNGGATGSASVTVSGGTPGYTYSWSPSGGTGSTASFLAAGNFTCTITDLNGCITTQSFTITQPAPLVATAASQTNISCNGGSNGSATVTVSGGTSGYSYSWTPSGGTAATASGLSAGTYTCTVTDANLCTTTQTFSITQPSVISITASQTNVSCNGGASGSATVVVAGGTPAYTYNWTPSGGTGATASSLIAGNYTCTITDANLCTATQTFSIIQPAIISVVASQTNVSCNGGTNGSATVVVSGGTPAYTYNWSPSGGNAAIASSLAAGTYTCTITDANLCITTQTFSITQPPAFSVTTIQTNVSCFGGNNGDAMVMVSGATPGYTYNWTPSGGNAANASSLSAGTYTCTITDANGCTTTQLFNITSPSVIASINSQTNISCFGGNNGSATVIASGGTPGYTYNWTPSGGTAASAIGLSTGNYTCTITDANLCTSQQTFVITQPPVLTAMPSQLNVNCFGASSGQGSVFVAGGTPAYSYLWSPAGGTGPVSSGLATGSYTCSVTDANACSTSATFIITEPTEITASTSQTDVLCFGGNTGSANILAGGGIPGYNYLWSPGGQTSGSVTGLTAGSYICTITDANGCTLDQGIMITEPNILASSTTVTNVICQGSSNGTATIHVTGGTTGYVFNWLPTGGTDSIATGLSAGSYTCNVTDANGCSLSTTVSISEPSNIMVTPSHTNVTCNGGNSGSASVIVNGGVAPYSYAWSPSGGTGSTATNLIAGTYTCLITDAGGCTYSQLITIAEPPALTATLSHTNVSCSGGSNGTAAVTVNGGSPFYSYNWIPSGGTGFAATGLSAGTYTCNITDANGCILSQSITITEPAALTATIASTNTNCGQSNGTATLLASGGTTPYNYSWTPSGGNASTANGILSGSYTCTLTDAMGCAGSYTVNVSDTPAPSLSLVSQTNILCNGGNNGDATVLATGGAGTYSYAWLPTGGTSATATSLMAGTYTCTVTDSAGCTQTQPVTLTEPTLLLPASMATSILCNGGNSTVTVSASGGTGPYSGTGTFTQTAGTYSYPVTDANGCSATSTITITEPTLLVATSSATSVLCNGGNSTVTVSANGGTSPYTGIGSFTQTAGTYSYPVTDANGCSATTSITITEPTLLTATSSATTILCNGGNSTVTVIANGGTSPYSGGGTFIETAGTYTYPVTDANGCTTSTSVVITQPVPLVASLDSVFNPTTCSGTDGMIYISESGGTPAYSFLWSNSSITEDISGLAAGTYSCTITDVNGCTSTVTTTLTDPAPPVVSVSIDTTICSLDAPYLLTEGNPIGGTWSGTGISGNIFDPSVSGIGSFVLTYTYTASTGCSASASDTMVVSACSGIDENSGATNWTSYPNPTFGEVTISTPENQNGKIQVEVYSAEGKLISSGNYEGVNSIHLDLAGRAAGMYLVRIVTEKETSTIHILKQ
jgi:hypothetical protein